MPVMILESDDDRVIVHVLHLLLRETERVSDLRRLDMHAVAFRCA